MRFTHKAYKFQIMNLKVIFLFIIIKLPFCYGDNYRISLSEQADITVALKNYFRAGFIFVADIYNHHEQDLSLEKDVTNMQKLFSTQRVDTVTSLSYCDVTEVSCGRNLGLVVMSVNNGQTARRALRELSRELRMSDFVWLLFVERDHEMEQFFTDINIPFDCEFLVAQQYDDVIYLTEVYRISPTDRLRKYVFGNWTSDGGLTWPSIEFNKRRNYLYGHTLRIGIINGVTGYFKQEKDGKPIKAGAYLGEVLNVLQEKTNFTAEFQVYENETYGVKTNNRSCNGLCSMLHKRQIDLSPSFAMSSARSTVIDFIAPMFTFRYIIVIKRVTEYKFSWTNILDPFTFGIWISLLCTIFLLAIFLWISYIVTRHYEVLLNAWTHYNLVTSIVAVFQSFCFQGGDSPQPTSCRIIYGTSYLASVVLLASYSASLISYLTVRTTNLPFHTFKEFLHDGTYILGVMKQSATHAFLRESSSSILKHIQLKMNNTRNDSYVLTEEGGLERVCKERNYAFLAAETNVNKYNKLYCEYSFIPEAFFPADLSIAIVKGSPYRKLLNHVSEEMRRFGLLKILQSRHLLKTPTPEELPFSSLQMTDVIPIFLILILGIITAIFILVLEFAYSYKTSSHRARN